MSTMGHKSGRHTGRSSGVIGVGLSLRATRAARSNLPQKANLWNGALGVDTDMFLLRIASIMPSWKKIKSKTLMTFYSPSPANTLNKPIVYQQHYKRGRIDREDGG
jgi:hypothetical protein